MRFVSRKYGIDSVVMAAYNICVILYDNLSVRWVITPMHSVPRMLIIGFQKLIFWISPILTLWDVLSISGAISLLQLHLL